MCATPPGISARGFVTMLLVEAGANITLIRLPTEGRLAGADQGCVPTIKEHREEY